MNHHGITPESLLNHPFREPKNGTRGKPLRGFCVLSLFQTPPSLSHNPDHRGLTATSHLHHSCTLRPRSPPQPGAGSPWRALFSHQGNESFSRASQSGESTGEKNANIKIQTDAKARERAFFGAATPVRARRQGFREWGGNSNPKRNLSLSGSEGHRFPLRIQFWVFWR